MYVAKLHTGQYKLKIDSFSLSDLHWEIYNDLKNGSKIIENNISFKLNFENEINLQSDKEAFKALLYNLVENAIKYTENGLVEFGYHIDPKPNTTPPSLNISSKQTKYKLKLFVKDTGIGIPEKSHEVIFDAFRKIESSNKKLYRGTGIGLALVKNLTEKLGGIVNLESTVNEGTSIVIEIPVS